MPRKLRIAYFAHSLRSDWNNGNAHFLRGLLRSLGALGHDVTVFEPETEWSLDNLRAEPLGEHVAAAVRVRFTPNSRCTTYAARVMQDFGALLTDADFVILHEWNAPALAHALLGLRDRLGFKLLFHDTHHRASSSPDSIASFGVDRFDGVLAFGESLRRIYLERFGMSRVWTLHEAADTSRLQAGARHAQDDDVVWVGNWGDGERSAEIRRFLLEPAAALPDRRFADVRRALPGSGGLAALRAGGRALRRLSAEPRCAVRVCGCARLTVHIPRQQ